MSTMQAAMLKANVITKADVKAVERREKEAEEETKKETKRVRKALLKFLESKVGKKEALRIIKANIRAKVKQAGRVMDTPRDLADIKLHETFTEALIDISANNLYQQMLEEARA